MKTVSLSITIIFLSLALSASLSYGVSPVTFSDNFERPDSGDIGFGWLELGGNWEIIDKTLRVSESQEGLWLAVHQHIDLPEDGFWVLADVRLTEEATWHGLAFHVQDAHNFYALRIHTGTIELIRCVDGAVTILHQESGAFPLDVVHSLNVSSEAPGIFEYSVTSANSLSEATNTITDAAPLKGGHAGVFSAKGTSGHFLRFHLSLPIPDPVDPSLEIHQAVELVFPTAEGFTYQVQRSTNLVTWEDLGEPIIGTGETISRLESSRGQEREFYRLLRIPN